MWYRITTHTYTPSMEFKLAAVEHAVIFLGDLWEPSSLYWDQIIQETVPCEGVH